MAPVSIGSSSEQPTPPNPISSFGSATDTALLERLSRQAADGVLTLRVGEVLPASAAARAHERLAGGGLRGRLVLDFANPQW